MSTVTIDLVTEDLEGRFILVAVEQGPWPLDTAGLHSELRRLQEKLYGYVSAAIDGALADAYPDSLGVPIVIRLNGYDIPKEDVESFFRRFADFVGSSEEYQGAIREKKYVAAIAFESRYGSLAQ